METLLEKSLNKHDFPEKRNAQDLKDAIRSVGRAKDPAAARRWIKKRAKELGKESLLPESWE
jgi:hypothetical protein